ncbi:MAG: ATP-dependent DNA helicase [Methanobacteriaceae archaeon]|nr:ATP-dependent DNA helicase [Methanobacteriaceae archaeon]
MKYDEDKLKLKFDLKTKGKDLESSNIDESISFYKDLLSNEYFINDYYPYRRLVMLYHKKKDYGSELSIIRTFFRSGIYCNGHNYHWFRNKAKRIINSLDLDNSELDDYCSYFNENALSNKDIQNSPLPIAERLYLSKGDVKVKTIKSYDKIQKQYEFEEIARDLKYDKKYREAIDLFWRMINEEGFNYYRNYQNLCQLYRKFKEYDNELEVIQKYYVNCKSTTKHSEEWFEKRLESVNKQLKGSISVDEIKSEKVDKNKINSKTEIEKVELVSSKPAEKVELVSSKPKKDFANLFVKANKYKSANKWEYSNYTKIDDVVKYYFPFENPREGQLETATEIYEAMLKGYKYIILEAGTGTGKSAIAACLASLIGNSYIFTMTKQLQEQYTDDFKHFALVKGRGNFKCLNYSQDGINETCDMGSCILEKKNCSFKVNQFNYASQDLACHYHLQKCNALDSTVVISNYDYMVPELNFVRDFSKRDLMIFDECHNLESKIMSLLTLELTRKELKDEAGVNLSKQTVANLKLGEYDTWISFIEKVTKKYKKRNEKYKNNSKYSKKSKVLERRIDNFRRFKKFINVDPNNWIVDYDSRSQILSFKPIKIDKYAKDILLKYGDVCLFMSASILDYKQFAKWLGINPDEIYPIRRKSPFDTSRNPIILFDKNMSYKNLKSNAPKTIPIIKEILEKHKNEKGIIHTVSYQCKDFLMDQLQDTRLIDHNNKNRLKALNKFEKSKQPLVLISPSMNEGVDLPGDKCRFQIIYKMPYPSISDKQIKARKNIENKWYDYQTAITLVQTYGRGMRSVNDYCVTYFIDSRLNSFIRRDSKRDNLLPNFFKDAIEKDF